MDCFRFQIRIADILFQNKCENQAFAKIIDRSKSDRIVLIHYVSFIKDTDRTPGRIDDCRTASRGSLNWKHFSIEHNLFLFQLISNDIPTDSMSATERYEDDIKKATQLYKIAKQNGSMEATRVMNYFFNHFILDFLTILPANSYPFAETRAIVLQHMCFLLNSLKLRNMFLGSCHSYHSCYCIPTH